MGVSETRYEKIMDRLDAGEEVLLSSTQSRFLPGGAALINPNTIFATNKRVIIRTPVRVGLAENIEEYFYDQITNIRIEKGIFSASLLFFIPGMTEISKEQAEPPCVGAERGRGDRCHPEEGCRDDL